MQHDSFSVSSFSVRAIGRDVKVVSRQSIHSSKIDSLSLPRSLSSLHPSHSLPRPHPTQPQVQQYVAHVTTQTKHNVGIKTEAEKAAALKAKKEAKEKEDVELKLLFMQVKKGGREGGRKDGRRGPGMAHHAHGLTRLSLPPSFLPSLPHSLRCKQEQGRQAKPWRRQLKRRKPREMPRWRPKGERGRRSGLRLT